MQIFVKGPSAQLIPYAVEPADTVESLKKQIEDKDGIPIEQIRLIHPAGEVKLLENDHALSEYNIEEGGTIVFVIHIKA